MPIIAFYLTKPSNVLYLGRALATLTGEETERKLHLLILVHCIQTNIARRITHLTKITNNHYTSLPVLTK